MVVDAYNSNLYDLSCHKAALQAAADAILEKEMLTGKSFCCCCCCSARPVVRGQEPASCSQLFRQPVNVSREEGVGRRHKPNRHPQLKDWPTTSSLHQQQCWRVATAVDCE